MSTDARKTILLVSPYWREAHRWMVSSVKLAELWQRMGYKVVVVCMGSETSKETVSDTLTIHSMKDFFLPDPWNYGIVLGFTKKVLHVAREVKPDYVIVNKILFWTSISVFRLRRKGYKVLLLTDALVGMTWFPRGFIPKICSRFYAWTLGRMILARASCVVFFHPQPDSILKKLNITQKAEVIPTGVDVAHFHVPRPPAGRAGSTMENTSGITVTYIGRLESVKGVDDFLAAAVLLKEKYSSVHIQVVGWYKKNHPLVKQYEDRVTFTGLRDDIADILHTTDIFVLPSYSEGLSNALMEAMASGCACIASNVGGNTFLIEHERSGMLYDSGNREALILHMENLINNQELRNALGTAARKRMEDQFSWDKVSEQYASLFSHLGNGEA